jgi:hypothetical protein
MGTTDAAVGSSALAGLAEAGVRFAFLHGEERVAAGENVGDYDLLVDARGASDVVATAGRAWRGTSLRMIAASEYDAGSVTVWLATADAGQGAQLDFTFDRDRTNQFDLPVHRWLAAAVPGVAWPTVTREHEAEYRRRKDAFKREGWRRRATWRRTAAELRRVIQRLTTPVGFHVHLRGADADAVAEVLVERFAQLLSRVSILPGDDGQGASLRSAPVVVLARYRNGLVISTSTGGAGAARPDLVVDTDEHRDPDRCAEEVTAAMAARLARQWSRRRL